MSLMRRIVLLLIPALTCGAWAENLTILNEAGLPIAGAQILLGYEDGNPFAGNVIESSASGIAEIPSEWKAALPVTVQAPGYVTTTRPVLMPGAHEIVMAKTESQGQIEVKGTTTGYGRLVTDGKVDFGLVIPAMTRQSMLSFDIASVISPQNDIIEIIGREIAIPSNIALPQQIENYFFSIEFNKPDYRFYVREPGTYQVGAVHGQFPLQRVVDDIRAGKSMFEVINHFSFKETGLMSVDVQHDVSGANMAVNHQRFNDNVSIRSPRFPNNQVMVGISLAETAGGYLPTDLKRFTPNQTMNLKSSRAVGAGHVLSVLMNDNSASTTSAQNRILDILNPLVALLPSPQTEVLPNDAAQDFSQLSFALLPVASTVTPTFLPMVGKPRLSGQLLTLDVPAISGDLAPAAAYMVFAEIEQLGTGKVKNERRTRLWEVWSPGWTTQVELPKINFPRRSDRQYRWEVMFLARPSHFVSSTPADRVDLSTVTHVTRNALDL
ncbi:MAG: hypothetical protein AB7F86_15295 [Bdellovibrionales bacterium]